MTDLAALREQARRVLDPAVWAYLEGGADDGLSVADAAAAWQRLTLHPHVLKGVERAETATTVLGQPLALPVMTAPNGRATRYCADGELALIEGTRRAGTLALLPSSVVGSLKSLRCHAPGGRFWQQLYMAHDRGWMGETLAAIMDAGAEAAVLTVDLLPDGRSAPPAPLPARWEVPHVTTSAGIYSGASLDDLAWLCGATTLPVIVKGVLRPDDALACVEAGAAGLIVSNHGGNQLDTAVGVVDALPRVAAAVAGQTEIYVDGGIRRGTSVLKALALGARAVLVGRPASHALAVDGSAGVATMLDTLRTELARAMALCGVPTPDAAELSLVGVSTGE